MLRVVALVVAALALAFAPSAWAGESESWVLESHGKYTLIDPLPSDELQSKGDDTIAVKADEIGGDPTAHPVTVATAEIVVDDSSDDLVAMRTEEIFFDPATGETAIVTAMVFADDDVMSLDAPSALAREAGEFGEWSDADLFSGDYPIVELSVQSP
jgi:hypothetical protein